MDNTKKIKAHKELIELRKKYQEEFDGSENVPSIHSLHRELERLELEQTFGLPLFFAVAYHYGVPGSFDNWSRVLYFDDTGMRQISWSDDGKQPKNEWLYVMSFGSGPYIFGREYPEETFKSFFLELKEFGAKYCDTANHCLYFPPDKAKAVHEAFRGLFKKHQELVQVELKKKRKEQLLKELKELD